MYKNCLVCKSWEEHELKRPHETSMCLHCEEDIWRICPPDPNPSRWRHIHSSEQCIPRQVTYATPYTDFVS